MITADQFIEHLRASSHTFVSGVPCSFLTPFINRVIDSSKLDYVAAASEGEAVGINLGAYLAGRRTVTLCQNSGLGNMVNPLTSLNYPFRIPSLLIVTWRGEPGCPDEPQHELMGRITHRLLETMEVPVLPFPETEEEIVPSVKQALGRMDETSLPVAFVMRKGSVDSEELKSRIEGKSIKTNWLGERKSAAKENPPAPRYEAIETILDVIPESAAVIATTGKTGRELYTLADRKHHLYVVGGMGTASGIGLGVALNSGERPVVVIDGDGAALMKLGTLATIGAKGPGNLIHIVLDNEVHDSTGGQSTVSRTTRFARIASAANYRTVGEPSTVGEFRDMLKEISSQTGPSLIHFKIKPGSLKNLGRPGLTPPEVKERFMAFLETPV